MPVVRYSMYTMLNVDVSINWKHSVKRTALTQRIDKKGEIPAELIQNTIFERIVFADVPEVY